MVLESLDFDGDGSLLSVLFFEVQQDVQSQSVFEGFGLDADAVVVGSVGCGGVLGFKMDALFFAFGV